jgi:carbonic anhydrase
MVTFADDAVKAQIKEDTGIRPPFALEAFPDAADDVRQSIARVKASPFIPHRDNVRGFVYDVTSGRLREVEADRELTGASSAVADGATR